MFRHTIDPVPEVNQHTHHPATPMRVYPSSIGDAVTFAFDADGTGMFHHGLRLTREQVENLNASLTGWLAAE